MSVQRTIVRQDHSDFLKELATIIANPKDIVLAAEAAQKALLIDSETSIALDEAKKLIADAEKLSKKHNDEKEALAASKKDHFHDVTEFAKEVKSVTDSLAQQKKDIEDDKRNQAEEAKKIKSAWEDIEKIKLEIQKERKLEKEYLQKLIDETNVAKTYHIEEGNKLQKTRLDHEEKLALIKAQVSAI